ncbi:MAG TPA: DMT family transporter [Bacteroidales bacterium]|mgnify:FL=1|nr:DMT family transporter [Bacteroidales bacterium]
MSFFRSHLGEFAALLTAFSWTITALANEKASKKIGSLSLNIIRMFLAIFLLSFYNLIARGHFLPVDANLHNWLWLSLSGLVGFTFGDYFLFRAYAEIGSRFSMLIMTTVPLFTAFLGWVFIGEKLRFLHFAGMMLTFIGISLAIFSRNGKGEKLTLKFAPTGILLALGGALGQATGLILSKIGMAGTYDPFAATQIRVIAGGFGFALLATFISHWPEVIEGARNREAVTAVTIGAVFGPFIGVSFSLMAVKYTQAGIASTIMAIVPVLIIPPSVYLNKEKVTLAEVAGAVISVAGVALFFTG